MSKSVGMAIRITPENIEKISIVNAGLVPEVEEGPTYFIFPYDYNAHVTILPEYAFRENFAFANTEDPTCFVDIDEK